MTRRLLCIVLLLTACSPVMGFARTRIPDWMERAVATSPGLKAPAVSLLEDTDVEITSDGLALNRRRRVMRIVDPEGQKFAVAVTHYTASITKIRSMKAWLQRPDGAVIAYSEKSAIDTALFTSALELYGEERQRVIVAAHEAIPDSVFAYEIITEERSFLSQRILPLTSEMPIHDCRFSMTVPKGWRVEHRLFNHPPVTPRVEGNTHRWRFERLAAFEPEPLSPSPASLAPWLALDVQPATPLKDRDRFKAFASWPEIATYFSARYAQAAVIDEPMKAAVRRLTGDNSSTMQRLAALARYAQKVNYISLTLNAGTGGGMVPRPASSVFRTNYGDCKDKANLLRTLLAEVGIPAYPVAVYAGDPGHVQPEWPSALQFNHCIVAIAVDDTFQGPAIVDHPKLGRLTIFDPTNPYTPLGYLSPETAGAQALLIDAAHGGLIALPTIPAESTKVERVITAVLGRSGSIGGAMTESFVGYASVEARAECGALAPSDYRKHLERRLAQTLASPQAMKVEPTDIFESSTFTLKAEFKSATYGNFMRDELLVFKPVLLSSQPALPRLRRERRNPVVLQPITFTEKSTISLPPGYRTDESVPPVDLRSSWGHYRLSVSPGDGSVTVHRELVLRGGVVPVTDCEAARGFFEAVRAAEQTPVVLKAK